MQVGNLQRRKQLRRYRALVARWGWLVVLCGGIAAGTAYEVGKRQPPVYTATTLLIVNQQTPGADPYTNILASDQLVQTYLTLIKTSTVLTPAAKQVGISPDALTSRLHVSNPGISTQIIQVQVSDRNAGRAAKLANAVATSLVRAESRTARANTVHVFQPAFPPAKPNHFSLLIVAVAGLAGVLLAAGLAWLLESLNDRILTAADVEGAIGLPTVGTVGTERSGNVLLTSDSGSRLAERFRILRTNLGYASLHNPFSTIVVTSATPGEGKTTVAINLAMSLALTGKRVMLVDADLHRPAIHERLGLDNGTGLTLRLLEDDFSLDKPAPVAHVSGVPNLSVLTAGPVHPSPTELLGSLQMHRFLESVVASKQHSGLVDVVVLDSPPVLGSADAAVLAAVADCTLLVVEAKRSRTRQLMPTCAALSQAGARVVGVVLNRFELPEEDAYAYYYQKNGAGSTARPHALLTKESMQGTVNLERSSRDPETGTGEEGSGIPAAR